MKRFQYTLKRELTNNLYIAVLEHSRQWCDRGLIVVHPGGPLDEVALSTLKELHPYVLRQQDESSWPGTTLLNDIARVITFKLEPTAIAVLGRVATRLYQWRQPDLPEDLCLLRSDEVPWLVSIAHERDAYVVLSGEERLDLVSQLPELADILAEDPDRDDKGDLFEYQ